MIITDKAQIKIAELRESNNLRLSGSDELECYELIESDLKLPADATFTRSSVAYLSDGTQVDANMPRFEQGRFGKATMVEEGTTNLISNGNCESDFLKLNNVSSSVRLDYSLSSDWAYTGGKSIKLVVNSTASEDNYYQMGAIDSMNGLMAGQTYTFSAYVYVPLDTDPAKVILRFYDYADGVYQNSFVSAANFGIVAGSFGRMQVTRTIRSNATRAFVRLEVRHNEIGKYAYFDAVQLEVKPYATSFIDGTRSLETLTIPTAGVLNPQEGTVEMRLYVNPAHRDPSSVRRFFGHQPGPGNSNRITMQHNNGPYWLFTIGDANGNTHSLTINDSDVADGWRLFTMKWGVSEFAVYVDGIKKAFLLNPTYLPSAVGQKITIYESTNALIDDLRISSIARSDEEILVAYQSGKPLAADEWTTYKLDFDDKVRITTQGQIICNELIEI